MPLVNLIWEAQMNPTDIVIALVVVAIVAVAARRFIGTATGKRDCCSGDKINPGAAGRRTQRPPPHRRPRPSPSTPTSPTTPTRRFSASAE